MTLNLGAAIAHIASIRTELAQRTGCTEWDNAGIRAALITTEGAPCDVSAAACLAAGDTALNYPSEAAFRAHWPKNASAAPRVSNDVPCPDHPEHSHPCPQCKAEREVSAALASKGAADVRAALADAPRYATPEQRRTNSRNQEDQP